MAYASLLDKYVTAEKYTLPEGCDRWAWKSTDLAGRTRGGFRWPDRGRVEAPGPIVESNDDPCPIVHGDGLCVALGLAAARSGGHRWGPVLLVAVATRDVLAEGGGKLRCRAVTVVDRVDGWAVVRAHGADADLRGANLCGADLDGADLRRADLRSANLCGADLRRANLCSANLRGANLCGADLDGADLDGAYLRDAIGVEVPS